jgi:hypothetical protein
MSLRFFVLRKLTKELVSAAYKVKCNKPWICSVCKGDVAQAIEKYDDGVGNALAENIQADKST